MAFALVGTIGSVSTGTAGTSVSPTFGTGESRTAGNLLVCWVSGFVNASLPATPSGWSVAVQQAPGTAASATIFYKVAAGSDSAPTIASSTGTVWSAQLGEFSGGTKLDQTAVGNTTSSSPIVATAAGADAASGNLVLACGTVRYSGAATKTLAHTLNNGATATETTNNGTSTSNHYDFAYGITTGNGGADSDSFALTTGGALVEGDLAVATFRVPVTWTGAATVSSTASLTAAGKVTHTGAATVSATASLTATGTIISAPVSAVSRHFHSLGLRPVFRGI